MAHRNAIIDGNRIKFDAIPTVGIDHFFDALADVVEMDMARHKLGK